MEQQLAAGLREGQIAEFVEDDEVQASETIGEPSLASRSALGLEPIDEVDGVGEAAARTGADAASPNGDRQVAFACAGSADQNDIPEPRRPPEARLNAAVRQAIKKPSKAKGFRGFDLVAGAGFEPAAFRL